MENRFPIVRHGLEEERGACGSAGGTFGKIGRYGEPADMSAFTNGQKSLAAHLGIAYSETAVIAKKASQRNRSEIHDGASSRSVRKYRK